MPQRPGKLRVLVQRQILLCTGGELVRFETVEAHQPIGLIKPVLADERNLLQRQRWVSMRDGAECRVVGAPQTVGFIKISRLFQQD